MEEVESSWYLCTVVARSDLHGSVCFARRDMLLATIHRQD